MSEVTGTGIRHLFWFAACLLINGCSGEAPPPDSYSVSGRVTFEGEAVSGGDVMFYHSSRSGGGPIDADGNFVVRDERIAAG